MNRSLGALMFVLGDSTFTVRNGIRCGTLKLVVDFFAWIGYNDNSAPMKSTGVLYGAERNVLPQRNGMC